MLLLLLLFLPNPHHRTRIPLLLAFHTRIRAFLACSPPGRAPSSSRIQSTYRRLPFLVLQYISAHLHLCLFALSCKSFPHFLQSLILINFACCSCWDCSFTHMGRKLNALLRRGFRASKCNTLLKLTVSRIKLLRNKRNIAAKQARKDIALLLQTGQEANARIRIETVFREENTLAAYDLIQQFCELVINRLPTIDAQKTCPLDLKEAIASLVFAAPRCPDLQELLQVRDLFTAKYGEEFAAATTELRPECGVNKQIIEKLSNLAPTRDMKLKLMKEIASEHKIDWIPELEHAQSELLKPPEDVLDGSRHLSEDPAAAQTGSKNDDASRLESINTIPSVDSQTDSATLASACPASPTAPSAHGDGDLPPAEGKIPQWPPWGTHDSPPHDTADLSDSQDAADSMTRVDADHDTGSMHVPFADTYSIAQEEGGINVKSTADPHSSTEEGECIAAPLAEEPSSLSKSDEPSSPPSMNPSEAGTYFKMGGRMEYKDFASAAQAAFESAARAAEAAQAAVDLARTFSKPSSDTKFGSSDSEEEFTGNSPNSRKAARTAPGLEDSKRNNWDNNEESWVDSHNARKGTNVAKNAPESVFAEQKGFDANDGETTSDSDDEVGGMSSSQHTIHAERLSRYTGVNMGTAADLDKRTRSGESERNSGQRRGAAALLQARRNEEPSLGRPRFDDDDDGGDVGYEARTALFADGRAQLDRKEFENVFWGSPNTPIQHRVFRHNSPFADQEGNSDNGEELGRKTRSKTQVNLRRAARKETIDEAPFEPQLDELDRAPLRSYNRKQETSHGQWYVAAAADHTAAAAAAAAAQRGNHLRDERSSRPSAGIAATSHRKLRWISTSPKEIDGERLQLELDSNDHEGQAGHNFGGGEASEESQKPGGGSAVVDESRTPEIRKTSYYGHGHSRRSIKSPRSQQEEEEEEEEGVARSPYPARSSAFEREDASTAMPVEDHQPNKLITPTTLNIPPAHSPSSATALTAHVLDRNSSSSSLSSSSSDSSIRHPAPASTNQTSAPQPSMPSQKLHPAAESPKSKPLESGAPGKTPAARPLVHPKLPDYDEFAARFKALKKKR